MADVIDVESAYSQEKVATEIRAKYAHYGKPKENTAVYDISVLLAEIDRLNKLFDDCYNGTL